MLQISKSGRADSYTIIDHCAFGQHKKINYNYQSVLFSCSRLRNCPRCFLPRCCLFPAQPHSLLRPGIAAPLGQARIVQIQTN